MKYIMQLDNTLVACDEASKTYTQLMSLPDAIRPVFLAADSAEVKAYFAALPAIPSLAKV
jgi:uncharacterized protein Yka (UPF0111/DUF47 family)